MIPIVLITGFLGSGKTSLLKEIIAKNRNRKFVYLINEFSPADVDGQLITDTHTDTVSIPGGSIFCKCLVTQFIHQLSEIPDKFGTSDKPIEKVIIEASGIADPKVIRKMLGETHLNDVYQLQSVISVIDPLSFTKLLHTLPNIRAQAEAADLIIMNKIDLVSDEQILKTENSVKEITPDVLIIKTTHCLMDFDIFKIYSIITEKSGEFAKCIDPHFGKFILKNKFLSIEHIQSVIAPISEAIFRLKGFQKFGDQIYYIDFTVAGWTITQTTQSVKDLSISIIFDGEKQNIIRDYLKGLELL